MKTIFIQILLIFSSFSVYAQEWEIIEKPLNKDILDIACIGDTLIASTGNNLYISYNLGGSWDNISPPAQVMGINYSLRDVKVINKRIYTFDKISLAYSDDFGKTWVNVGSFWGMYHLNLISESSATLTADGKVYLEENGKFKKVGKNVGIALWAMGNRDKICVLTLDNKANLLVRNGDKWTVTEISEGLVPRDETNKNIKPINMLMTNEGDFLALYDFDKLYKLNQKSNKWEVLNEKFSNPSGEKISNIAKKGNSIWITTSHGGFYRTDDNGKTFSEKLNPSYGLNLSKDLIIGTNHFFIITHSGSMILKEKIK